MLVLQDPAFIINVPHPLCGAIEIARLALGHGVDQAFGAGVGTDGEQGGETLGAPAGVPWQTGRVEYFGGDDPWVGVDVGLTGALFLGGASEIFELDVGECEAMLRGFGDAIVSRTGEIHVVPLDTGGLGVRVFPIEDGHDDCLRGEAGLEFSDDEHACVVVQTHFQVER